MYQEEMHRIYVVSMDTRVSSILREVEEQRLSLRPGVSWDNFERSRHISPNDISDLALSKSEQLIQEGTSWYQQLTGEPLICFVRD